jgi:hypothetical protein
MKENRVAHVMFCCLGMLTWCLDTVGTCMNIKDAYILQGNHKHSYAQMLIASRTEARFIEITLL